jgi:hypothetical protein
MRVKTKTSLLAALLLVGGLVTHGNAEIISKTQLTAMDDYCHLTFPAITEDSLSSDHPMIKSSESADIIDFYGDCNESPTGKNQVASQKRQNSSSKESRQ